LTAAIIGPTARFVEARAVAVGFGRAISPQQQASTVRSLSGTGETSHAALQRHGRHPPPLAFKQL